MSGRIRSIKPELLDDAMTAGLTDTAFRLFIGSVLLADDYGDLRWEPAWLRAQVFWKTERALAEVESSVRELQEARLVLPYVVADQRYAAIRNWAKHQKVDKPGKPRIPGPPETLAEPSRDSRESLATDLRSPTPISDREQDQEPREPVPPDQRFSGGTSGVEARGRYESAMFAITKKPYGFQAKGIGTLCELLNTHARDEPTRAAALDWLERTLAEWVAEADPKYTAGWSPVKLNDWLNERNAPKRPVSFVRGRRPEEITKQPYDPNAPWMKAGES